MDLRKFGITPQNVERAKNLLRYQPFILTEDLFTGVGYSWLHPDRMGKKTCMATGDDFIFERGKVDEETFNLAWKANARLAEMYNKMIDFILLRVNCDSFLEIGCNTGYFPVMSNLKGVKQCYGVDHADYENNMMFLNEITGAKAEFFHRDYIPGRHDFSPGLDIPDHSIDVVFSCAVLIHISDPLYFLTRTARMAKKAYFVWAGFSSTDEMMINYRHPGNNHTSHPFPNCFDLGVVLSEGLLKYSMKELGFTSSYEFFFDYIGPNNKGFLFVRDDYKDENSNFFLWK
ncbi:MAG: class I SAM-dependent methyltransferase [Proteobacteria bacterium]|nr:class I SAM-dependent methyltransferase [Pseudomonadota bacterium]